MTLIPVLRMSLILKGGSTDGDSITNSKMRYEVRAGTEASQRTASGLAIKYRRIDKDGQEHGGIPWYEERVLDPDTGEAITDKSHPLREKGPSGSAKRKR